MTSIKLKERYTKDEAKKAKDGVARRVKNGSLEVMQGAAYKAHITKRTGRRGLPSLEVKPDHRSVDDLAHLRSPASR